MNENAGTAVLTVTLSGQATDTVTVNYATSQGTATAGRDYAAASGTVRFNRGVTSQTISIGIIDNKKYTNQSMHFTVTLGRPSANATLGTPSTCTVNVLDNDPAPVADIEINNVAPAQKNNPGGFVQVNANNDNGSILTYADGVTQVPAGAFGIPQMRDFDPKNVGLATPDPDLLQILLQVQNLQAGGPETISLTVGVAGRANIQIWDTGTKNSPIQTPTNWTVATMPASVFVEGLVEGAALGEVTLTLQILNNGTVVSKDTCTLTVTPVLTNLVVNAANGFTPDLVNDPVVGWAIVSEGKGAQPTVTETVSAQWDAVRGDLRFIQNVQIMNNLAGGGASLGPPPAAIYTWDFDAPNAGKTLVDVADPTKAPFYRPDNLLTAAQIRSDFYSFNPAWAKKDWSK